MKNITILNFSPRNNGNCSKIMDILCEIYNRTNVSKYNVGNISPCGNCDYECLKQGMLCPNRTADYLELMDAVCDSDLIYYIVPNFC